ncbi:hypothetical protein K4K59_012721 [Colletotrichum sp. SAR11_240]|nr:hypothetical protein K4K59_012721 [Colletotrichum sp. SAR11_240]
MLRPPRHAILKLNNLLEKVILSHNPTQAFQARQSAIQDAQLTVKKALQAKANSATQPKKHKAEAEEEEALERNHVLHATEGATSSAKKQAKAAFRAAKHQEAILAELQVQNEQLKKQNEELAGLSKVASKFVELYSQLQQQFKDEEDNH